MRQRESIWRRAAACGIVLGLAARALGADGDAGSSGSEVSARLVLEEVGGGTDSAVSPDGQWIAFSSRRSGNLDVWIVNTETRQTRQITTHPATDNEARWHPEGTHLVFVTQRNRSQDIYMLDLRTGEETPIATEPFNEDYPSFAKDASEICFTGGPPGFREVQVYNFATGRIRTVTRGFGYVGSTNFSPDGQWIVFHAYYDNSYNSGKSDLFIVPAQGGEPQPITHDRDIWDYKPNWSWDGRWITFSSKRETPNFNIWIIRPDGSDLRAITRAVGVDLRWSNWTRDGRLGWHQVNPQTGRLRLLDIESGQVADLHLSDFNIEDLAISPDRTRLVYETDAQIYVVEARPGAEPQRLLSGLAPRWTPDGRSIAYLRDRRSRIAIVSADGGEPRLIDLRPSDWPAPAADGWSPDGRRLAVAVTDMGAHVLTVVEPDGSKRPLVAGPDPKTSISWSADGRFIFFAENHPASVGYYLTTEPVVTPGS